MSIQRKLTSDSRNISPTQTAEPQERELIPQTELSRLWEQILSIRERNIEDSENKFQTTLLFATLEKICGVLTASSSGIESQLKTMNQEQMKLLNLQSVYEARVRGEVDSLYSKTYYVLREKQEEVFRDYENHIADKLFIFEQAIEKSTAKCNQSIKRVETVQAKLFKLKTWWDLIWYASPIAVFLNLVFMVYRFFAGG
jgi:hypothetical protein